MVHHMESEIPARLDHPPLEWERSLSQSEYIYMYIYPFEIITITSYYIID